MAHRRAHSGRGTYAATLTMAIEGMHIKYPRGESQTVRALVRNMNDRRVVAGRYIRDAIPGHRGGDLPIGKALALVGARIVRGHR